MASLAHAAACALALGLYGCSTPVGTHDGGGGTGGTIDLATQSGDLGVTCSQPGACGNGGVCCMRSIGPHELIFCDTTNGCAIQHGVDTTQTPLCNSAADCARARHSDLGMLYCCPDPNFTGISVCRSSSC